MSIGGVLKTIAVVALSGCVTPYGVDGTAEVALVRFKSDYYFGTTFDEIVDLSFCPRVLTRRIARTFDGSLFDDGELSSLSMYGSSKKPEHLVRERKVVAGKRLLMHVAASRLGSTYDSSYHCGIAVSFIPDADKQYEVHFLNVGSRCTVNVSRLDLDASGSVVRNRELSAQRIRASSDYDLCPK